MFIRRQVATTKRRLIRGVYSSEDYSIDFAHPSPSGSPADRTVHRLLFEFGMPICSRGSDGFRPGDIQVDDPHAEQFPTYHDGYAVEPYDRDYLEALVRAAEHDRPPVSRLV